MLIRKILLKLTGNLPCRIISNDENVPYLERYYLGTLFGVRFYIHHFVGSDPDRGLHDHPWRWAKSIILAGEYYELTLGGFKRVRWFNAFSGDYFHRVIIGKDWTTWTLFLHPVVRSKDWGFLRQSGTMYDSPLLYSVHRSEESEEWWLTANKGKDTLERVVTE